jgi:iron complex transport system ATP-binding protein
MNGSGKSTLLKCMGGLLPLQTGLVSLHEVNLHRLSRSDLAGRIAYLPQHTAAVDCSVFEAVLIGRKARMGWQVSREDIAETNRLLQLAGLQECAARNCSSLSGGELQRVAIARTLAQQPQLLLLDEPVNHLDIHHQLDVLELLRQLTCQLGIITIAVLHDLNMALRYADRFLLMREGRVIAEGGKEVMTAEHIKDLYQLEVQVHELDGMQVVVPCSLPGHISLV